MIKILHLCFFLCILTISSSSFAHPASSYVHVGDRAYRDIEMLVSHGLCYPPIVDQKPFARSEFARMIAEASKNFDENFPLSKETFSDYREYSKYLSKRAFIESALRRLKRYFNDDLLMAGLLEEPAPDLIIKPIREARFDLNYLSEAPLRIISNNGIGKADAVVNPLSDYVEGRHAIFGFQSAIEADTSFNATKYFAAQATFRLEGNMYRNNRGEDIIKPLFQEGYGVLQAADAAITLGRAPISWGPGEHGGLLLTNDPRPLDQIGFSTPSPFQLPWVFRHLGHWRIGLFGANLGPNRDHPYAWLTGYRLSYQPAKYVELGFGNITMMGGEGAPSLSALDVFGEFWGFRPAGTSPDSTNKTNHIMEAAVLIRIPPAAGLTLYGVLANEDKRDTLVRFFRDGSSYLAGFYLPRVGNTGKVSLRFEFKRMCAIMYRHSLYYDGFTLDRLFIGDDLGSNALGTHLRVDMDVNEKVSVGAVFDWDKRGSNIYKNARDPDGSLGDIVVAKRGPSDIRYRFLLEPEYTLGNASSITLRTGYERALNAGYVQGLSRNNWIIALSLKLNLDSKLNFKFY
ncbi:MAG TPA: capsule assembly Wzi family protein [bacterium]|nr:capsule assembly Wzi family protein [Myxococcales bacterium]HQH80740.1 capsule assembly Wzi family protein [bacterium]